jgi:hypothetical protein
MEPNIYDYIKSQFETGSQNFEVKFESKTFMFQFSPLEKTLIIQDESNRILRTLDPQNEIWEKPQEALIHYIELCIKHYSELPIIQLEDRVIPMLHDRGFHDHYRNHPIYDLYARSTVTQSVDAVGINLAPKFNHINEINQVDTCLEAENRTIILDMICAEGYTRRRWLYNLMDLEDFITIAFIKD